MRLTFLHISHKLHCLTTLFPIVSLFNMMNKLKIKSLVILIIVLWGLQIEGAPTQTVNKTFEAKKTIRMKTIMGNCLVKRGDNKNILVNIEYTYPQENYKPKIKERKNKLILKEKLKGNSAGEATWFLTVPENIEIVFTSVCGSLSAKEMKGKVVGKIIQGGYRIDNFTGKLNLDTTNGDIWIKNSRGNFKINTHLGNIIINDVQGCFSITTFKGDLKANDVELHGTTEFTTYYGKAEVILSRSAEFSLSVTSGLGDVVVNYNDNPLKGHFEMIRRASFGKIESPVPFESEEEFQDKGGIKFLKKSFNKSDTSPQIVIKAHMGNAILKER